MDEEQRACEALKGYYDGLRPTHDLCQKVLELSRQQKNARRLLGLECLASAAACLALALCVNAAYDSVQDPPAEPAGSAIGSRPGFLLGGGSFLLLSAGFTARYRSVRKRKDPYQDRSARDCSAPPYRLDPKYP